MASQESNARTKTCTKCGETKPIEAFKNVKAKGKSSKLYRLNHCRKCGYGPRALLPDPYTHQTCTECGETKPLDAFTTERTAAGGYRHQCRACRTDAARLRYAKNPEPHKQAEKRRRRTKPAVLQAYDANKRARRRALLTDVLCDLTAQDWQDILAAYAHRCAYCGRKLKRLTQDHITPVSKGGAHTKSNVVPACQSCNSKKHAGPPLKPVQPLLL